MAKDNDRTASSPAPHTTGEKLLRIVLKIAKVLLIVVVAVLGLYLIGVNLVLNIPLGQRLGSIRPEIVQVRFSSAWTLWPGRVHVKNADISGQDSENQFWVTAETAAITFTTKGIRTKDVTGTNLRGDGVTIKIRRRVVKLPPEKELAKLPPIQGFPSPLKPDLPDRRVIGVRLEDIKATHVREIWVDGFRVTGDIDAEGGMYYKPKVAARVYPSNIVIKEAKVTTGEQKVASELKGTVWVNVEEIDLHSLGQRDLRLVSAATDLSLHIDELHFINDMLPKGQGIAVEDGAAKLTIAVKIDQGVLGDTSKIKMEMPNIGVTMPLFRARTAVELGVTVDSEKQHAVVAAEIQSLVLTQRSNGKADVRSKVIRLKGHNNTLDLAKKMNFDARVELPAVVAGDLTFANDFIPKEDKTVQIEKGSATLSGHFNFSSARHRLDGLIDVEATKLGIKNNSAHIFGLVKLHGLLNELDTEDMSADIGGTWFALENVSVFLDNKETPNWKFRVDLTKGAIHPQAKRKLDATVKVYIKNLQPAVNVIATNIKIPWIAKALAYREDVVANTHIELEKDTLVIPRLNVENDSFIVQGRLKVTDLQKKPPHQEAAILIKIAGLTIGIELHDKSVKPILVNAQGWFDGQVAAAGGPSMSAAALQEGREAGAALGTALGNAAGNAVKPVVPKAVGTVAGTKQPPQANVKPVLVPVAIPPAPLPPAPGSKAAPAGQGPKAAPTTKPTPPETKPAAPTTKPAPETKPATPTAKPAPETKPAAAKPAAEAKPAPKPTPAATEANPAPAPK